MGIMSGLSEYMLRNRETYGFSGRLLTLGAQTVFLLPSQMKSVCTELGVPASIEVKQNALNIDEEDLFVSAECYFKTLGANTVQALDVSNYQNAEILFDLSNQKLPSNLEHSADCIFDGSTTEHIFDCYQVFRNLHKILAPGGLMCHLSPLEGLAHDSFYQFGLNFFDELYSANNYTKISHQIYVYDYEHLIYASTKVDKVGNDWFFDNPEEGLKFARSKNLPAQHLFRAKKPEGATAPLVAPFQGRYYNNVAWKAGVE